MSITVATISWRSASLISGVFSDLLELAERPAAIQLLVGDNTGGRDAELAGLEFPQLRVLPVDIGDARMSMAHALGLNALCAGVDTPYLLVVDPDVAIFAKNWDRRLIDLLERDGGACVGAPYPPWKLGKYHAFPSPIFAFWRVAALRELVVDWRPYAHTPGRRWRDFAMRQLFWLPRLLDRQLLRCRPRHHPLGRAIEGVVGTVSKDTGWWIAEQASGRGMRAELFEAVTDPERIGPAVGVRGEYLRAIAAEFELYLWQEEPFLTHRNPTWGQVDWSLWGQSNRPLVPFERDKAAMTERWLGLVRSAKGLSIDI